MAVMRVHKTKDYTVMSNTHFREKEMSLKAKGLLSLMFSLPDTWDYSIAGLVAICKENETAIKSTLAELKEFGYLSITKLMPHQTESGRIEYIYDIFEIPSDNEKQPLEKQGVEKQGLEILPLENRVQLNTNKVNTKILNTKKVSINECVCIKEPHTTQFSKKDATNNLITLGTYNNVILTINEYDTLANDIKNEQNIDILLALDKVEEAINFLSQYLHNNPNKKYNSHFNSIKNWVFTAVRERKIKQQELELKEQEIEQRKERIERML